MKAFEYGSVGGCPEEPQIHFLLNWSCY